MAIVRACNIDAYERNVKWFREQEGEPLEIAIRRAQLQLEDDCKSEDKPVPERTLRSKSK